MKKLQFLLLFLIATTVYSQSSTINTSSQLYKDAPEWAKLMYGENPNVNTIDNLYSAYFETNSYIKSYHTQYYKRWRRAINPFLNEELKVTEKAEQH